MPVYEVDVPGKGTFTVNSRRPLSDEQAYAAVLEQLNAPPPAAPAGPAPEAGLPAALKKGLEGFASSYQTGVTAPFGAEEAAAAGLARQEALGVSMPSKQALIVLSRRTKSEVFSPLLAK